MQRRRPILTLVMIIFAVTTIVVTGADAASPMVGKIKDIDTQEVSLVIGLQDQDRVIYLDSQTPIAGSNGQKLNFSALKLGMTVSIDTVVKQGEHYALKVSVLP